MKKLGGEHLRAYKRAFTEKQEVYKLPVPSFQPITTP